ncbi:MAG: 50S ribosomal protein L29 [Firmicutes bacterium]|nr:50S ribosomal protein L29 [Bacillota bacterium]
MKAKELKTYRGQSVEELNKKLDELKKDLFMLRMQHATNQLDNPMKLAAVRKDIARIKTIIREKQIER